MIHAPNPIRRSGQSVLHSMSGRSRPSVLLAKNQSPMTRMMTPKISEALPPRSAGGGRHVGAVGGGGGVGAGCTGGGGVEAGDGCSGGAVPAGSGVVYRLVGSSIDVTSQGSLGDGRAQRQS